MIQYNTLYSGMFCKSAMICKIYALNTTEKEFLKKVFEFRLMMNFAVLHISIYQCIKPPSLPCSTVTN